MIFVIYKNSETREDFLRGLEEENDDDDSWGNALAELNSTHMLYDLGGVLIHQIDIGDYERAWIRETLEILRIKKIVEDDSVIIEASVPSQLQEYSNGHFHYS
jgi:hypothetical protein